MAVSKLLDQKKNLKHGMNEMEKIMFLFLDHIHLSSNGDEQFSCVSMNLRLLGYRLTLLTII